jgi:hypothetical protein
MSDDGVTIQPEWGGAYEQFLKPSRYKAVCGGRGSGKSHYFAQAGVINCSTAQGLRMVCIREYQRSLKESAKLLIEDKIRTLGLEEYFRIKYDEIITPGDGLIIFQGMQDHTAATIASLEGFDIAWVEEAHTLSKRSWELLRPTIRAPGSEIWASWNPRSASDPVDVFFRGANPPPDAIVARINWNQNPWFPDVLEEERQFDRLYSPDRYAHIWEGEYEPTVANAIFNRQAISDNRRDKAPDLGRILIPVDPAITSPETNKSGNPDYHGITVVALGEDGRGYVLEDASMRGGPIQWATRAIAMYDKWEADAIVIEVNQGGDMVRHTLESIRRGVKIIEVRATRGKHVRAEPISSLYALGRVSHIGTFTELEDQLCKFTSSGYEGGDSPDRAESVIWGFTELFPKLTTSASSQREDHTQTKAVEGAWMS